MISNEKWFPVLKFITRAQAILIIVFIIIILLGKTFIYRNKSLDQGDQLTLVFSSDQTNHYIFMDLHSYNITRIVQIRNSDEESEYEKFKYIQLQECDQLNIIDLRENGKSSRNKRVPVLSEIFLKPKMQYLNSTKPHEYKQNFIQIFEKDCQKHKTYYNNEIVLNVLLELIFKHIYPIQIKTEKQHQHNQLQQISLNFNIDQKHTMNIKKYLESRFQKFLWKFIQQTSLNVDIYIGDQNDLLQYYNNTNILKVKNQGSYKYYIQENDNKYKLIVSGISNIQRLINFKYILKFSKVDFQNVSEIGSINDYQLANSKLLLDQLNEIDIPPIIAYIGNRKQALIEVAKKLYRNELMHITDNFEAYAISLLQIRNSLITKSVNSVFRYSYLIIQSNESQIGIICLRMPNGQLSYEATKSLLAIGVKQFFLVGAGGAINPNLVIGDYIQIVQAQYYQESVKINPKQLINLINFQIVHDRDNITIDSPLEETQSWLFNNRHFDCVDIETFHILKALENSPSDVTYLAGIFISDLLTTKPLQDKIGINNAYRAFSNFMQSSLVSLKL